MGDERRTYPLLSAQAGFVSFQTRTGSGIEKRRRSAGRSVQDRTDLFHGGRVEGGSRDEWRSAGDRKAGGSADVSWSGPRQQVSQKANETRNIGRLSCLRR